MGLLLTGGSLLLFLPVMAWQLGPVFHSSEFPWLLLSTTALLGQALGYATRGYRWPRLLLALAMVAPLGACALRAVANDLWWREHPWLLLAMAALLASGSSLGLSRLLSYYWTVRPEVGFRRFYRLEIGGALALLAVAVGLGPLTTMRLFPWLVAGAVAAVNGWPLRLLLLVAACGVSLGLPGANQWAAARAYPGSRLCYQQISPYQYVEVLENAGRPYLFLNGLTHYGPAADNQLNRYLAEFPALHLPPSARPAGCIILGAGSLVAPAYTRRAGLATTVVELDPLVVEAGRDYFADERALIYPDQDWRLVVGDARQELHRLPSTGLIVVNLPSPASLSVASLFTREFFTAARQKLVTGGQFSLFLGSPLDQGQPGDFQAPIVQAVLQTFPEVLAISSRSCDNTILLASSQPLGDSQEWHRFLRRHGQNRYQILERPQLEAATLGVPAASLANMRFCAAFNRQLWRVP